jgi:hypothetical protein
MSALTRGGCVGLVRLVPAGLLACLDPAGPLREVSAIRKARGQAKRSRSPGGRRWAAQAASIDAQAHPEYNREGGRRMFVTYSRSTGLFSSEVRLVALALERRP